MLLSNTIQAVTTRIQNLLNGVVRVLRVRPAVPAYFAVAAMCAERTSRPGWQLRSLSGQLDSHRTRTGPVPDAGHIMPVGMKRCLCPSGCLS